MSILSVEWRQNRALDTLHDFLELVILKPLWLTHYITDQQLSGLQTTCSQVMKWALMRYHTFVCQFEAEKKGRRKE